jgi:hypothetical protein
MAPGQHQCGPDCATTAQGVFTGTPTRARLVVQAIFMAAGREVRGQFLRVRRTGPLRIRSDRPTENVIRALRHPHRAREDIGLKSLRCKALEPYLNAWHTACISSSLLTGEERGVTSPEPPDDLRTIRSAAALFGPEDMAA